MFTFFNIFKFLLTKCNLIPRHVLFYFFQPNKKLKTKLISWVCFLLIFSLAHPSISHVFKYCSQIVVQFVHTGSLKLSTKSKLENWWITWNINKHRWKQKTSTSSNKIGMDQRATDEYCYDKYMRCVVPTIYIYIGIIYIHIYRNNLKQIHEIK